MTAPARMFFFLKSAPNSSSLEEVEVAGEAEWRKTKKEAPVLFHT